MDQPISLATPRFANHTLISVMALAALNSITAWLALAAALFLGYAILEVVETLGLVHDICSDDRAQRYYDAHF